MSSPEVERFEISDADVIGSMYGPRMGRRQTKNQATYGIWADDDSDDERPGFGGSRRKKNNMSVPMSFVSGGIKQGDKITKEGEGDEEVEEGNDVDFNISDISKLMRKKQKEKNEVKGRFTQSKPDKEFGSWERHTKGVGMKLMQKMGFEVGKGLGKTNQGITTPVEAVKRQGRGAIGLHGSERSERSLKDFPVYDSEEEEEKKFQEELHQWKKKPEGTKKKPKYNYKTAQEAIDTGGKKTKVIRGEHSKVKVIDMTGKEQKVMKGYHSISKRHDKPDEDESVYEPVTKETRTVFSMPELMHNLNLLVDMSEEDIILNDRKLNYEKDHIVNMQHECERLDTICEQEDKLIDKLTKVLNIVEMCNERTSPGCENPLSLQECASIFKSLQDDYYEEYKMYDLEALAIAMVFPLMRDFFSIWEPLRKPQYGTAVVKEWQYLLSSPSVQYSHDRDQMDVYQRLVWDIWLPHVRTTILKWNVRECDPLIDLLETWMPLLPPWVMENILDQLVLPRLLQEVENWNPLTDTMPIHAWLHPWLPLMGDKLEPLYAPIRHKLANALTNWHPSDGSAKVILQPWMRVFKPGHMEAFLVKNIVPKLALCLQEFQINPHQQALDPWTWVMSWNDIIPIRHMAAMLEKAFFPRWLQVLCTWLGNMPNYDEITKWYLGWKSMLSEEYLAHPGIKEKFSQALDMMNRAVSGHFQPGVKENIAYFTHTERRQMGDVPTPAKSASPVPPHPAQYDVGVRSAGTSYPASFKELVQRKAEENNIIFVPVPGKTQEAKPVYRFGKIQMYFDRNVVFMLDNNGWIPVSLQKLLDCAKG